MCANKLTNLNEFLDIFKKLQKASQIAPVYGMYMYIYGGEQKKAHPFQKCQKGGSPDENKLLSDFKITL